jgi:ribonuclease HI
VIELDNKLSFMDCHWVKAYAGNHGNGIADRLAKGASTRAEIES